MKSWFSVPVFLATAGCLQQGAPPFVDGGIRDGGADGGERPDAGDASIDDAGQDGGTDAGLYCIPSSIDFGTVTFGESVTVTLTCTNARGYDAAFEIGVPPPPFQILSAPCCSGSPFTLTAGASTPITVAFDPMAEGSADAGMWVRGYFQDGMVLQADIPLTGTCDVLPCDYTLTPSSMNFGPVTVGSTEMGTFTVANVGQSSCLLDIELAPDCAPAFSFPIGPLLSLRLDPTGVPFPSSSMLPIAFTPPDAGSFGCGFSGTLADDGGLGEAYFQGEGVE
jgi:hypothetical protein